MYVLTFIVFCLFLLDSSYISVVVDRKYLEEPCVWVESNTSTLSILSSQAEIGLGFLLVLSLFSSVLQLICLCLPIILRVFFLKFPSSFEMQVAAQHNTNIHVLAGLFCFFLFIYGLWTFNFLFASLWLIQRAFLSRRRRSQLWSLKDYITLIITRPSVEVWSRMCWTMLYYERV